MNGINYDVPAKWRPLLGRVTNLLTPHMTSQRLLRLQQILEQRKRGVLCVFENTHHSHNISAVLRTVEALGFLESVFVYNQPQMRFRHRDSVERGSSQWLLTRRAAEIPRVATRLKEQGYQIALVSLPEFSITAETYHNSLPSFSCSNIGSNVFAQHLGGRPLALVLGSELQGVSEQWVKHADLYVHVKMDGFVESLNVSVCAGMLLHALRGYCESNKTLTLSPEQKQLLLETWICRAVKQGGRLVEAHDPALMPYFEFVRRGGYFDPFPEDRRETL